MFNRLMTNKEKMELKKEITKVTPVTALPKKAKAVKQVKLSKKAETVAKVLKGMPNDWRGSSRERFMVEAFEAVLGEKIVLAPVATTTSGAPRIDKGNLLKFQAIVPEGHAEEHNYPLGKTVLLLQSGGNVCLKADGTVGNAIRRSSCRYASLQEIESYLNELQKKASVDQLARYLAV